jgi:methanogenic corrinoid protein MtbC1
MVAEWFARAGWQVACAPGADWASLVHRVASEWVDVVGLSVSLEEDLPQVASAILDIRSASTNPSLLLMVGGPLVARLPDLAVRCGADVAPADAPAAVLAADHWVQARVKRA